MIQDAFITQAKAILKTAQDMQREIYYWQLLDLAAAVDARLRRGVHLRGRDGRLIERFDQWLLAAGLGEWPSEG